MTFIEHWVDILSLLVVAGGIGWLFHFLQSEGRSAERPVSEKPALFLEFTGKQMFVRPERSKLVPISRKNGETPFPAPKPPMATPVIKRLREDLVLLKMLYIATARDFLRALRLYSQRWRTRMRGVGRQMKATNERLMTASRARLAVMRARLDGDRSIRPNRRVQHRVRTGFHRMFDDLRLNLDIQGHRLDRAIQTQWKKCQGFTERWADAPPIKLHMTRLHTKKLWNHLAGRVPVQSWMRKAKSVRMQQQDRLMAGYTTLQGAARGYIRRLWEANTPAEKKPTRPARAAGHADPIVIGLTSSGTLKLRSRLEDEGVSQYGQAISEPRGSRSVSKVTVRFIGTAQRHSREPGESKKVERMVKP